MRLMILALMCTCVSALGVAGEGMWLPEQLPKNRQRLARGVAPAR